MKEKYKHIFIDIYKFFIVVIGIFYGLWAIFTIINQQTDDNLYQNLNSFLYLEQNIPIEDNQFNIDSITSNYVIRKINDNNFSSLDSALFLINNKSTLTNIQILSLVENKNFIVRVNNRYLTKEYLAYHRACVHIFEVKKGGVSDNAGIFVGDLLVCVNGDTVSNALQANKYILKAKKKGSLNYKILRNRKNITFSVPLSTIKIPIINLIIFISGLLMIIIGLIIGLSRSNIKSARISALMLISYGIYYSNLQTPPYPFLIGLQWVVILFFSFISLLLMPLAIHALFTFIQDKKIEKYKKLIIQVSYLYPFIIIIFFSILVSIENDILNTSYILSSIFFILRHILFHTLFLIFIILSLYYTYINNNKSGRAVFIAFSIIVGISLFTNSIAFFTGNKSILIEYISSLISKGSAVSIALLPLSYLYIIAKYRIFDLDIKMKRNIIYFLMNYLLKLSLVAFFIYLLHFIIQINWNFPNIRITNFFIEYIDAPIAISSQLLYEKIAVIFTSLLLIFILYKIHDALLNILDLLFSRVHLDYQKISAQINKLTEKNNDPIFIAKSFIYTLGKGFKLKRAGIIFINENNNGKRNSLIVKEFFGMNRTEDLEQFLELYSDSLMEIAKLNKKPISVEFINYEIKDVLMKWGIKYIIPTKNKDKCYGLIFIGEKQIESIYTNEELSFLLNITNHIAIVIDNSLLYEDIVKQERMRHELELARQIQADSLPSESPNINGLQTAAISLPAYEVGGDFFDYFSPDEKKLNIIIGDVSGKGTSAALYVSNVLGILRTLYSFSINVDETLIKVNGLIYNQISKNSYITATYAQFDTEQEKVFFARAGHTPIFHFDSKTKKVKEIITKGLGLGLTNKSIFEKTLEKGSLKLVYDDIFLFFTDGITEIRDAEGNEAGERIIYETLYSYNHLSTNDIIGKLIEKVNNFSDFKQIDDITVVVVKIG